MRKVISRSGIGRVRFTADKRRGWPLAKAGDSIETHSSIAREARRFARWISFLFSSFFLIGYPAVNTAGAPSGVTSPARKSIR